MDVCEFCRVESEYMVILYHRIAPKTYEPLPICPSCLYERGKYDSLRPESNIWTEEE